MSALPKQGFGFLRRTFESVHGHPQSRTAPDQKTLALLVDNLRRFLAFLQSRVSAAEDAGILLGRDDAALKLVSVESIEVHQCA